MSTVHVAMAEMAEKPTGNAAPPSKRACQARARANPERPSATNDCRQCGGAEAYLGEHRLDDGHEDVEGDGERGAVLHNPLGQLLVVIGGTPERRGLVDLLASHCRWRSAVVDTVVRWAAVAW